MKPLVELLTGYADPKKVYVGVAPIGENGLMVRVRSIAYLATAVRCLDRDRIYRLGMKFSPDVYYTYVACMKQEWQSEILRIMDVPSVRRKNADLPNLTVRLMSKRFQEEPSISQSEKDEERRLFAVLSDRYDRDGYKAFRDKLAFHIDLEHALREPANSGNLYEMTDLIVAWFKHVGTVILKDEPRFATVGAREGGRTAARTFRRMLLDRLRYRRHPHRAHMKAFESP